MLAFDEDDLERGIGLQQVVGRPQAGEARADDGDVGGDVAGQRRAAGAGAAIVLPERHCGPVVRTRVFDASGHHSCFLHHLCLLSASVWVAKVGRNIRQVDSSQSASCTYV